MVLRAAKSSVWAGGAGDHEQVRVFWGVLVTVLACETGGSVSARADWCVTTLQLCEYQSSSASRRSVEPSGFYRALKVPYCTIVWGKISYT